ncbi:MAG: MetQ/NlpA family ABC transporter substrate-binding protein [Erysipelotrichales bacterium]
MKKIIKILSLFSLVLLVACSNNKTNEDKSIKIGAMGSIDAFPLVIAKEKGFFKDNNLNANIELFTDATKREAALQSKSVDGVLSDDVAMALYENSGMDMKVVSKSTGNFSLVASKKSNINKLSDLKGKKIAIAENSMIEYLSEQEAIKGGVQIKDLKKITIPPLPARLEGLGNGEVDAAILPAPFDAIALKQGHKVIDTISNDDAQVTVYSFYNDYLTKNPQNAKSFVKSYNEAVDYINNTDIKEYEDLIIEVVGYSKESKGNIKLPKFSKIALPDTTKVQKVFDWTKDKKMIDKEIKAEDVMYEIK